jgi:hypothetical protein
MGKNRLISGDFILAGSRKRAIFTSALSLAVRASHMMTTTEHSFAACDEGGMQW